LKEIFHYRKDGAHRADGDILLIEISDFDISACVINAGGNQILELISAGTEDDLDVEAFFKKYNLDKVRWQKIKLLASTPGNVFYPANSDIRVVNEISPEVHSPGIFTDELGKWGIRNSYSVPSVNWEKLKYEFPGIIVKHSLTSLLQQAELDEAGTMMVNFGRKSFSVLVTRQQQLLIAGYYDYTLPADVVYYLLSICHQYGLSREKMPVIVSGLVDLQSAMYKELYLYFVQLSLRRPAWDLAGSDYPAHYFTNFNDLLQCE
jgi:hypothetical protein